MKRDAKLLIDAYVLKAEANTGSPISNKLSPSCRTPTHKPASPVKSPTRRAAPEAIDACDRLSCLENYTTTFKNRTLEKSRTVSGDFHEDPKSAMRLLHGSAISDLTIPGRAMDFSSTVTLRMQLRSHLNS